VLTAVYLAPKLINSELLKGRIENVVSQKVGGRVEFQAIDLSIFPRPNAIIRNGSIITETASGTLEALSVYPKILPLLTGKLQVTRVLVKSPDIKMSLLVDKQKAESEKSVSSEVINDLFAPLALALPDLVVEMEDGKFNFVSEDRPIFFIDDIDFRIIFPPAGLNVIKAEVKSDALELRIQRKDHESVIKASKLKGSLYYDKGKTAISLSRLIFDYPSLKLAGELSMDNNTGLIGLILNGSKVDVQSIREAMLAIAGDIPVTENIFQIVKGGNIPSINFNSHGSSFDDLGKLENIVIKGSLSEGEIFVPGARLDLKAINGDVMVSKGVLEGEKLQAQLDNTSSRNGSLKIGLEGEDAPFHLETIVQADLSELPPLLKRIVKNKAFVKELSFINNLNGMATGRLVLGESLNSVKARLEVSDLNLAAAYQRIPFPLEINAGHFYYDESGFSVKKLNAKAGKSAFSDITLQVDLIQGPLLDISSGSASIIIDEIYPWLSGLMDLPDKSFIQSPLSVSKINILLDKRAGTLIKGNLSLQKDLDLSFDIYHSPDKLKVNKLTVRDKESTAQLALNLEEKALALEFDGNLSETTVNKIISDNTILNVWIKGDFRTNILKDNPTHSTFQGRLEGKDIVLPLNRDLPLNIKSASLDAAENSVKVVLSAMTLGENNFNMKGDVNTSKDGFIFDFDISTDKIEWDILKDTFAAEKKDSDTGSFFDFPVKGIIRLSSESFTFDTYTFKPVHAEIAIDPDNITITVTESDLCDISFPGTLQLTPKNLSFEINPAAKGKEFHPALSCLLGGEKRMTGKFALSGKLGSEGSKESIADLLYGNLEFLASEGRIYRLKLLSIILAFLNITEIYRGVLPAEVIKEGFAYHSLSVKGDIKDSVLFIKESRLDGYSMNIFLEGEINLVNKQVDLEVLAAPLKTTDFIVDKIPVLRDITGGTIVSIPLKVTGDIENPKITYLSVSAVGSRLLNIMNNTLKTPVKVIEPIITK
jgi:hypothetical protein